MQEPDEDVADRRIERPPTSAQRTGLRGNRRETDSVRQADTPIDVHIAKRKAGIRYAQRGRDAISIRTYRHHREVLIGRGSPVRPNHASFVRELDVDEESAPAATNRRVVSRGKDP